MRPGRRRREGGFTYLGLLILVAVIGIMLAAAGELAATTGRREREAQLLWVGHAYRDAIARYWQRRRAYPRALEELLGEAPDAPVQVRDLRQLYRDPMAGPAPWVLVPAPDGGIMGVASSSRKAPLKTGHFDPADQGFADATTYGDWQFTFTPGVRAQRAAQRAASSPR